MVQVGIVGLPNVGKSSLYNALTAAGVPAENYPFCTVDPNVGTVEVPDSRLSKIQELAGSRSAIPTFIRFVDIAGLVRGASKGEGLGNQFLGQIREVDAIAHVLRCFRDPNIAHVMGSVDPVRDRDVVETELALADLEALERRREKVEKKARSGERDAIRELAILQGLYESLSGGRKLRRLEFPERDTPLLKELNLLSQKPVLFIANVGEGEVAREENEFVPELKRSCEPEGAPERVVSVSAAIEADLALLDPDDRAGFLSDLGLERDGLARIIHAAYDLLDLITFFSANEKETRAWAVPRGTRAPEAGGVIHTDFQRGFIRAEAIGFEEFEGVGSMKKARDRGLIRSEGGDYEVEDGDILLFRFSA
jgi:GTP-binding protein YchF